MPTRKATRINFNELISGALNATTVMQINREAELSGLKMAIYNQMFGAGTLISTDGRDLIKTIDDAETGGLKAINLDRKQIEIIFQKIEDLANSSNLRLTIEQIKDRILSTIINLQAATRQFIIKKLKDEMKDNLAWFKMLYSVKPTRLQNIINDIKNTLNKIKQSKKDGNFKTIKDFSNKLQEHVSIGSIAQMAIFATAYGAIKDRFGKIPVLLGPVPLKHVDHVEVARSGKVLKFRATGSIYLAGQQGGEQTDAIKIEGTLYKAEFGFMFLLWALFLYGQSKFKDLEKLVSSQGNIIEISKLRKMNDLITTDTSLQRPSYDFYRTFPFVNKHFIIPNCYIQTILMEDKLPLKDIIKYSILLRTYKKPIEAVRFVKSKDENISIFGFTKKTFTSEICQYSLTAAWRMFNAYGWMADELEWRIGSASKPGVLDTYYDIDPTAIGTVTYLSLMGAVV